MTTHAIPRLATHIPGFDTVAHGGLPETSVTLLGGSPGSGKTVFAVQMLAAGIRQAQQNGAFVTFEEKPARLCRHMSSFGWDLAGWERENRLAFVDASPRPDEPPSPETGPFDFGGLLTRIEHAVRKVNARRVAFDSISTVFGRFSNQSIVRFELFRLSEALQALGVTSLLTAERGVEEVGDVHFASEDFVVDNVVLLRNRLEDLTRRRTVEILKCRGASHQKGEFPFTILPSEGIVIIPITEMQMTQRSGFERVSSGVAELDRMCGGGLFRDSIVLVTGATGCGKTLITTEFVRGSIAQNERTLLFGFEESRDQLFRNAHGWGVDFEEIEKAGSLKVICAYPETSSLEDHLARMKEETRTFQPRRIVIDSLSALERVASRRGFREFVVALTCFAKENQITGMFTLATPNLMSSPSVTEGHISSVADSIILLRYVELYGEMRRGVTVLKMRGSQHDKEIREFTIDGTGMHIGEPFRNVTGILSGRPVHLDQAGEDRIDEIM